MLLRTPAYRRWHALGLAPQPHDPHSTQGGCDDPPDLFRGSRRDAAGRCVDRPTRPRPSRPTAARGAHTYNTTDWDRFYHYPYVYYPQNFWGNEYYRSADSLYYRYPAEMRIPVYNRHWFNDYPTPRPYYQRAPLRPRHFLTAGRWLEESHD